jgi:AraC-like DNA-binding protein
MPIFMDRHNVPGITAKDVAEVHQADIKHQDEFGCKVLTYWFDENSGIAFCLIDAPEKNAVIDLHKAAHGVVPNQIIEVQGNLVQAFLGRITDPEKPGNSAEPELNIINETAIRTIIYVEFKPDSIMKYKTGKEKASGIVNDYYEQIHQTMKQQGCRKIKDTDDGFIASFISESDAVKCAKNILNKFIEHNRKNPSKEIIVSIGISTGAPVTEKDELFGGTIQEAKKLSYIASSDQIVVSSLLTVMNTGGTFIKTLKPDEEKFLYGLMDLMENHWNQSGFGIPDYSSRIGVSQSQLYRKTTALFGQSPNEFIRGFRLRKALKLIEKRKGNISEIAYESGFSNPSYFTQCFQKRFGLLPSEYESLVT